MPNETSPKEMATGEPSTFEKMISYIPGYKGYREKEIRRETDNLVRGSASRHLGIAVKAAERALANAIESQGPDKSRVINRLIFQLNYLYSKSSKPPIGHTGLLDAVKAKEEQLDELVDHDFAMVNLAEEIETKGKELLELTMRGDYDSISKVIEELQDTLSKIEEMIAAREAILRGV